MPSYYAGDDSPYAVNQSAAIIGATNATPIVVQTSSAHLYATGDRVVVASVGGNTAANSPPNQPWPIQVIDSTHYSLTGSVGNGAYTSGGVSYDLDLLPVTLPSDGDPPNASSFTPGYEGLADRTRILRPYTRVQNVYAAGASDDTWAQWVNMAMAGGSAAFVDLTNGGPAVGDLLAFTAPVPRCDHGDAFRTSWQIGNISSSGIAAVTIAYQQSCVSANAFNRGTGDAKYLPAGYNGPVTGCSYFRVESNGSAANITVNTGGKSTVTGLTGMSAASVGATLNVRGAASQVNNGAFPITDYISATSVKVASAFGVAPDANNGALTWWCTNMTFSVKLMIATPVPSASTVVALGHRSMSVVHYRPPSITIPLL
jgi:hypothetical protein